MCGLSWKCIIASVYCLLSYAGLLSPAERCHRMFVVVEVDMLEFKSQDGLIFC